MKRFFLMGMVILLGAGPAQALPKVRVEAQEIKADQDTKALSGTENFRKTKQMFTLSDPEAVTIGASYFDLDVLVENRSSEDFVINQTGVLTDQDWVVDAPELRLDVKREPCEPRDKETGLGGECQGDVEVGEIAGRLGRRFELRLHLTEAVHLGDIPFRIGLRSKNSVSADSEGIIWSLPLKIAVREDVFQHLRRVWEEREQWRQSQEDMRGNGKTGVIQRFYLDGVIKIEENYQDGRLNGVLRRYYENGVVQEEANYRDDQLDGDRFLFQKNKEMERFEIYSNGDLLGFVRFSPFDSERDKQNKIRELKARVLGPPASGG